MRAFPLVNRTTAATIIGCFDLSLGFCSLAVSIVGLYFQILGRPFFFYILPSVFLSMFGLVLLLAIQKKSQLLTNTSLIVNAFVIASSVIMMVLLIFAEVSILAYTPLLVLLGLQSYKMWIVFEFRKVLKASLSSGTSDNKFILESEIKCHRLEEEVEEEWREEVCLKQIKPKK